MKIERVISIVIGFLLVVITGLFFYSQSRMKYFQQENLNYTNELLFLQQTATQNSSTQIGLENQISTLQAINKELQQKYNNVSDDTITLKLSLVCQDSPNNIDFTSNSSVSNSLKQWLEKKESITNVNWKSVWNNSPTTIHQLSGEYLYEYVVFFADASVNTTDAVFDIQNMCWLKKVGGTHGK